MTKKLYDILKKMDYSPGLVKDENIIVYKTEYSYLIGQKLNMNILKQMLSDFGINYFSSPNKESLLGLYFYEKNDFNKNKGVISFSKIEPLEQYIYIPYEKNLSPQYLNNLKDFLLQNRTSDINLTLDEFIKTHHIIKEENYTQFEKNILKYTENELNEISKNWDYKKNNFFLWENEKNKKYYIGKYNNILLLEYEGEIAGGIINGTRYILPKFRRKGLGVDIVIFCHYNPQFKLLFPSHYSEDGYKTRLKAFDIIKNSAKYEKKF